MASPRTQENAGGWVAGLLLGIVGTSLYRSQVDANRLKAADAALAAAIAAARIDADAAESRLAALARPPESAEEWARRQVDCEMLRFQLEEVTERARENIRRSGRDLDTLTPEEFTAEVNRAWSSGPINLPE